MRRVLVVVERRREVFGSGSGWERSRTTWYESPSDHRSQKIPDRLLKSTSDSQL